MVGGGGALGPDSKHIARWKPGLLDGLGAPHAQLASFVGKDEIKFGWVPQLCGVADQPWGVCCGIQRRGQRLLLSLCVGLF